ncbi:hypothetical protein [Mesorhizobium sp. ES1-4]|uniref:hypothetical protein n=1 Tax=Mesorhizobium sp. ES1-4 TaxID=2876627 RepID=UPI001CCF9153|nr:hypothetical protein [Mesorhizobium sp. ES1-4]MBZ9794316.1 hypothetical protein [Mesorhizobium sp. ES1-4]
MTFPFPVPSPSSAGAAGAVGPATSYFNAGGRGDRTSSITTTLVSGSLLVGSIGNLVNGGVGANSTDSCAFNSGQTNTVLKFDFGTAKIIDGFRWFQNQSTSQGTYAFEGSNDDSSYTQIGGSVVLGASSALTDFSGSNTTAYRYYRLRQTAGTTSNTPWLEEIEFRIAAAGDPARDAREYGDRTALITPTTTVTLTGGAIDSLVDGALGASGTDAVIFSNGQTTKEIKFDFGSGVTKILTGLHWIQDATGSHGTWVFEGSNDDSSYTGLGSSFTLGGALVTEVTWSNSTAYRYYKLRQTSGSTTTSIYNVEAEFRIT